MYDIESRYYSAMSRVVLTLLFLVLIVSLNRDETWALPSLSDQILTEADLEEIIDRGLPLPQIVELPVCNCDAPTDRLTPLRTLFEADECDCASEQQVGWICGTPILQAEAEIRKAKEAGLHPWAIAQLIELHCGWLGTCKFEL